MGRTITIFLPIFLLAVCFNLSGQQKASSKPPANGKATKRLLMPAVYLGNSDYKGGPITKEKFATLMRQGLTSRDSLGNKYHVVGFDFGYAERKVYEDSVGNLMRVVDFASEYCTGDTLGPDLTRTGDTTTEGEVSYSIYDRAKPGDTLFFDHVMVEKKGRNSLLSIADTVPIAAKGIKCVIVK